MTDIILTSIIVGAAFIIASLKLFKSLYTIKNNPDKCSGCQGCMLKDQINKNKVQTQKVH